MGESTCNTGRSMLVRRDVKFGDVGKVAGTLANVGSGAGTLASNVGRGAGTLASASLALGSKSSSSLSDYS